jgi:tetratricopeptide (TPR) repeat protein
MRGSKKSETVLLIAVILLCNFLPSQGQTPSPAMREANALMNEQKWAEAAKAYEKITTTEPANGRAWYQLALARHSLGDYAQAVDAYLKVPALSTNPSIMYNLACSYARLKENNKAFEWLNKAIGAGFPNIASLKTDPDLAGLREDARFKDVIDAGIKATTPCMVIPEHQQFNFWVGEWDVKNPQGQQAGTSSIQRIVDGCVILENWTGAGGGSGKSFNFYDAGKAGWRQVWVGSNGIVIDFEGQYADGAMRYKSASIGANGQKTLGRMTFFNLGPDKVRQLWEQSTDDGKTWVVAFDGIYIRKK